MFVTPCFNQPNQSKLANKKNKTERAKNGSNNEEADHQTRPG